MLAGSSMIVRKYKKSDFSGLGNLYQKLFTELRTRQGYRKPRVAMKQALEIAAESVKRNSWVLLAEDDSGLIGFSRVQILEGAYFVREVFVVQEQRRRGVGSRLLAACEELVKQKGETSIFLSVEPKNSASIKYLIHNGYDTLNMLELRKDFSIRTAPTREDSTKLLNHTFQLLKRS